MIQLDFINFGSKNSKIIHLSFIDCSPGIKDHDITDESAEHEEYLRILDVVGSLWVVESFSIDKYE